MKVFVSYEEGGFYQPYMVVDHFYISEESLIDYTEFRRNAFSVLFPNDHIHYYERSGLRILSGEYKGAYKSCEEKWGETKKQIDTVNSELSLVIEKLKEQGYNYELNKFTCKIHKKVF